MRHPTIDHRIVTALVLTTYTPSRPPVLRAIVLCSKMDLGIRRLGEGGGVAAPDGETSRNYRPVSRAMIAHTVST